MNAVYITLPLIQFVVSLFLASLVIFSDPRSRQNRIFAVFLGAMAAWGITIFGMRDSFPDAATAYAWEKAALAVIPFSGIIFFHFVREYTGSRGGRGVVAGFYAAGVAMAVLSLTGQVSPEMVEKFYGFAPKLGWAMPLLMLTAYVPVFGAIVLLTRAMRRTGSGLEASPLRLLRLGAMISALGGASDLIPSAGLDIYPLGVIGNIGFGLITTYAVTRHHLMNLRLVLRQGMVYMVISSLILGVYGASFGLVWLFTRTLSTTAGIVSAVGAVVVVSVFVQPVMGRVQRAVDRIFFRERHDRLVSLLELSERTRDITDFSALASGLIAVVRRTMQADWVTMILPDQSGEALVSMADSRPDGPEFEVPTNSTLASWLARHGTPVRRKETEADPYLQAMSDSEREQLEAAGADLMVPMLAKGELTGIIALGPKLAGGDYSAEDLSFLASVADRSAMVIENSRMYAVERERLEELERLDTLKSNLLLTVSHELKSPLTAIKTAAELLEATETEAPSDRPTPRARLLRTLKSGVSRLERLTQESLDYAAMQSANLELNLASVDLRVIAEDAAGLVTAAMRSRQQTFTLNVAEDLGLFQADAPRVERILSNLLTNANKFTPAGGSITVDIRRDGSARRITVTDTGEGIPSDEQELVFSPYYRSKNADGRGAGGSGLGLSIARYLAELHGGSLTVESTLGRGSVFALVLPSGEEDGEEDGAGLPDVEPPGDPVEAEAGGSPAG